MNPLPLVFSALGALLLLVSIVGREITRAEQDAIRACEARLPRSEQCVLIAVPESQKDILLEQLQ